MSWQSPSDLADRRERGTELCRRLTADVTSIAPPGIGRWGRAWEIVADADSSFMIALTSWEATGDDSMRPALRAAYARALDAWREAVAEWQREAADR
jgi:hypothetical protein